MIIESKDNKLIKYAKKLQDRDFSQKEGKTLVESPKIIKELCDMGLVETVMVSVDAKFDHKGKFDSVTISSSVAKYLSQTETTTGVFAIVTIPKYEVNFQHIDRFLILDNIQDPNNLGSIMRSAVAFGYETILCINCTYAYSSKVARCSMGNNFKCKVVKTTYDDIAKLSKEIKCDIICCDMNGISIENSRPNKDKFGIIIGNEGNGVADELRKISTMTIAIPMMGGVESLNASVSAGIIMYNLNRVKGE